MNKLKNQKTPASGLLPPNFDEVAALIVPSNTPAWLKGYLESWASSLVIDRGVSAIQPTRVDMRKQLMEFSKAAALVEKALTDTAFMEFLESAGGVKFEGLGGLQKALQIIASQAQVVAHGPQLVTKTGRTKSGRGRALPPGGFLPKHFCAILIVEAWKFLHGVYPVPRNEGAAAAAHAYWLASGGTKDGWGANPHGAWRQVFQRARNLQAVELRAEIQRHLMLQERKG